jgi:UDP-N-acetylmuramate--alanine ligase
MKKVHLIGIGGTGLSAIARVLLESGYTVSGSDRQDSPVMKHLDRLGAQIFIGHQAENIGQVDLVVRSSAIPDSNSEVTAAVAKGIPVLKRSDFLSQMMAGKKCIAVAGTHGKTTTTAMIAWMLHELGTDPSYIIGSDSKDLNCNAHAGSGSFFVIEADEYDRMFHGLTPELAILTNLEHDHPDCYPTMDEYEQAFLTFIDNLFPMGKLIINWDDHGNRQLSKNIAPQTQMISYGLAASNAQKTALQMKLQVSGCYAFVFSANDGSMIPCALQVPGTHNVKNALAALIVAEQLGLSLESAAQSLGRFTGTGRRMDVLGIAAGVTIIDDYAHHPTEIRATLSALRDLYPQQRIWTVWQPHTFSRTMTLFQDYTKAFSHSDYLLITDVYAARETNPGFDVQTLANQIEDAETLHFDRFDRITDYLLKALQPGDVLIVLSAGDAIQISQTIYQALFAKSINLDQTT